MLCSFLIKHGFPKTGSPDPARQRDLVEKMFRRQNLRCTVSVSGDLLTAVSFSSSSAVDKTFPPEEQAFLFSGILPVREELFTCMGGERSCEKETLCLETSCKKYGLQETLQRLKISSYAAGFYDRDSRKVTLCSDPAGSQRIFFYRTENCFVASNDLSLLKQDETFPGSLAPQQIWDYFSLLYVPCGSVYKNVHCLAPGDVLNYDMEKCVWNIREHLFFREEPVADGRPAAYQECCAELERLVKASVKRTFDRADTGKVGVFLSGGVDSAILAGLAAENSQDVLHCCSIAFRVKEYDERSSAEKSARYLHRVTGKKIMHHVEEIQAPSDFSFLEGLIRDYGQPFADSSLIPSALLCRFASEYGSVFLGGDGADELFRGYERYIAMRYLAKCDFLPEGIRKNLFRLLKNLLPGSGGNMERTGIARLRRLLLAGEKEYALRYFSMISHGSESVKKRLCTEGFVSEILSTEETFDAKGYFRKYSDVALFDTGTYLPGDCLSKTFIASKGSSLRVECPFLAQDVMDFALRLPVSYKEKNRYRKRILCDTFSPYLYEGLARGKKRGFGVPVALWMRHEWKKILAETLLDGEGVKQGIFSAPGMESILQEHANGLADHSYILFSSLMLELFLKK